MNPILKITAAKGKYFIADEKLISEIKSTESVKYISRTLSDKALLKNIDKQVLVTIKGVDENFSKVAAVESSIEDGVYGLNIAGKNNILLGRGIANQLQVNIREFVNELSIFSPVKGKSSEA